MTYLEGPDPAGEVDAGWYAVYTRHQQEVVPPTVPLLRIPPLPARALAADPHHSRGSQRAGIWREEVHDS